MQREALRVVVAENRKLFLVTSNFLKSVFHPFKLVVVDQKDPVMEMVTVMGTEPVVEMAPVAATRSIQENFVWTVLVVTIVP